MSKTPLPTMKSPSLFFKREGAEVIKRNGNRASFDPNRIQRAIEKAFRAELNFHLEDILPENLSRSIEAVSQTVIKKAIDLIESGEMLLIEKIQDLVEKELMEKGYHAIARGYILYREERKKARLLKGLQMPQYEDSSKVPLITLKNGTTTPLNLEKVQQKICRACEEFKSDVAAEEIIEETIRHLYNGMTLQELNTAMILAARVLVEKEPAYNYVAARLLLQDIYNEVFDVELTHDNFEQLHIESFARNIKRGVSCKRLSPELLSFDLEYMARHLDPSRDSLFTYLGIQTLYDRYLIHDKSTRIESPQYFWMRVAMGLSLLEKEKREEYAVEFYNVLSTFSYVASTPTLFNAGSLHPQLSSCYLLTVNDDLESIFKLISDNASLAKWSGGLGNDWTNIRATGAVIKGTNGVTQGVIPFLKVANDTAVAVNQGGKRKGAVCAYLETWHLDIEDFLELRKNTGDERRRTHDMNTANWIPDLFMKRVKEQSTWTLFNPYETPDLHNLYGKDFEERYCVYEQLALEGKMCQFKTIPAVDLWRKMLTMLFETGHPWITFKDPSNIRSPQSHVGVVHSSNLCTEILLNTSDVETAVCNLGSINLLAHHNGKVFDELKLAKTIRTAMRMLDNVIDINFYPTAEARHSNLKHRPVGLGMMGFQDVLYKLKISYDSPEAVDLADISTEMISYYAILASSELAKERGVYSSYVGSKWHKGLLPIDTVELVKNERGGFLNVDTTQRMDWNRVRMAVKQFGMRNSNTLAIAPTATIAHISDISQSIEPTYSNLYAKSNLSGDFTILNPYLVEELKSLNLWDDEMLEELKYNDGSIQTNERIPSELKRIYKTAFEIAPEWLISCASRRQKWIDMGQSLNLYVKEPNGKKLSDMYFLAWESGLKTTYYLRSLAATQVEKSTMDVNKRGIQPRHMKSRSASSDIVIERSENPASGVRACRLTDSECESCQ